MGAAERVAAQRRMLRARSTMVDRIAEAIRREIPAYESLGEAQWRETEAIAAWGVQRLLEVWVDRGALDDGDLRRFHGIGVARGTDGRPLFAVLRAYRVAAVQMSSVLLEVAGDDLELADALDLNRVLLESLDVLSEALFAGYTSATQQLAADRAEVMRHLVDDLLTGRQTSSAALADRSEQLGISLPSSMWMTVVGPGGSGEITTGDVAQLADGVADDQHLVLHTHRSGQGILLHAQPVDLAERVGVRGWRACVFADVPLGELRSAYRIAAPAVEHAPAEAFSGRPWLDEADASFVALLRGEPRIDPTALAERALRAVLEPGQAHVLAGLDAYLLGGSSIEAGKVLGIHPQTMRYRLRRLRELTGRDLGDPWDRLLLTTANTIRAMGRT